MQKACSMRKRSDVEDAGERLTDISRGSSRSQIDAASAGVAVNHWWLIFSGVIGARRRRIIAVIRRDDQQSGRPEARTQLGQPAVEALQIGCVPGDIVSMSEL